MSQRPTAGQSHPRQEPRIPLPLSLENLEQTFAGCADFNKRQVYLHGDPTRRVTVCYIGGMARTERINDYVFRPLAQNPMLASVPESQVFDLLEKGAIYAQEAKRETELDQVALAIIDGSCALFFPGRQDALVVPVSTEEKRSVGEPENEPSLKGARDSFVESLRTNTSLVRRRLRAPELRV